MKDKLRVGIILCDNFVPSWQFHILSTLVKSDYAKISLVIKTGPAEFEIPTAKLTRLLEKADRIIFKKEYDFNRKKDASCFTKFIPEVDLDPDVEVSISKISYFNTDILINLSNRSLANLWNVPKYGVWSFSINTPKAGFWEVLRKRPVTFSALEILKDNSGKKTVIFGSWESTCNYSMHKNRNQVFWRAALFIPRVINGLYKYGDKYLFSLKRKFESISPGDENPSGKFSALTDVFIYGATASRYILKKLFLTDDFNWHLLFDIRNERKLKDIRFRKFNKLIPPHDVFWADPFVIAKGDYFVFVEEFIYKKGRAHISVLKLDQKGNMLDLRRIIEKPYHMSYPFIFIFNNTYYMIPETCKNKTIELYKCTSFPYKWEFERNIMENLYAVDSTLFNYNNNWWLFTSIDQTENISGTGTELFLFYTDDLLEGKWKSHPMNPIVSDARNARPAGKIFIQDAKIFRPAQDGSVRYGRGFNFNEIIKLSETEYEETMISSIKPSWDKKLKGAHTYNFDHEFTIIDVYSFRKRFGNR